MADNISLLQKQQLFAQMVAVLIQHAKTLGYEVTLGEAYRTPEQAQWNAEQGRGIARSLHMLRLAIDLNLYKNGTWLPKDDDHRPLGEWWESQGGTWGGRFGDGNHYSLEHKGVK
jgi:hypothetical protein